ncbi:unnamed protein product [Sympodiomycopsis kandeliae]
MSRSQSGPPPFPVPTGWGWDGRRMYKLEPRLSRVQQDPDMSWEANAPSEEPSALPKMQSTSPPPPVKPSAFHSTPACPPASFFAHRHGSNSSTTIPRNCVPSFTTSRRFKRARSQHHTSSLLFHSRDNLGYKAYTDEGELVTPAHHKLIELRLRDNTGSLLWTEVSIGPQIRPFALDMGGRRLHKDQDVNNSHHRRSSFEQQDTVGDDGSSRTVSGPIATALESQSHEPELDTRHLKSLAFEPTSKNLRGIEIHSEVELPGTDIDIDSQKSAAEPLTWKTTIVRPDKHWAKQERSPKRIGKNLATSTSSCRAHSSKAACTVSAIRKEMDLGMKLIDFVLVTSKISIARCPRFHATKCAISGKTQTNQNLFHTALCINEETGWCWVGFRSGSIQVLDTIWLFEAQKKKIRTVTPTIAEPISESAVTNLVDVGLHEAIAAFSDGTLVRFRKPQSSAPAQVVQKYFGHVNEGDTRIVMCADAKSRLIAVRGVDGCIRIWHFDDAYPLNSPWHEARQTNEEVDLLPDHARERNRRLMAATRHPIQGPSLNSDRRQTAFETLAFCGLAAAKHNPEISTSFQMSLSELRSRSIDCMRFVHTSWVANRDSQWEHVRTFGSDGEASNLTESGQLPALCIGVSTGDGPRLLYFEQSRHLAPV